MRGIERGVCSAGRALGSVPKRSFASRSVGRVVFRSAPGGRRLGQVRRLLASPELVARTIAAMRLEVVRPAPLLDEGEVKVFSPTSIGQYCPKG
jgi:hypothetical protein